jgi:hypothetical protein
MSFSVLHGMISASHNSLGLSLRIKVCLRIIHAPIAIISLLRQRQGSFPRFFRRKASCLGLGLDELAPAGLGLCSELSASSRLVCSSPRVGLDVTGVSEEGE